MNEPARQRGFTLVEVLVVTAIVVLLVAIAVPSISATLHARAFSSTVNAATNRLAELRAAASNRHEPTTFDVSDLVLEDSSMVVNPGWIEPPEGIQSTTRITFQGGTGACYALNAHRIYYTTERRSASIIIANSDDQKEAYAIIVGSTSRIRTLRKTADGWEEISL